MKITKNMKIFNESKGITLIALVIIIIILLILAGITIGALAGDNGLIKRAQDAKNNTLDAQNIENVTFSDLENLIDTIGSNGTNGEDKGDLPGEDKGDSPGDDGEKEEPEWKKISVKERIEKLKNNTGKMYIFDKNIGKTSNDISTISEGSNDNFKEGQCECGKLKEIFDEAIKLNLVKVFSESEYEKISDKEAYELTTATLTEPSLIYYDFQCKNSEQKAGVLPMAWALNYEISIDTKTWFDGSKIMHIKDEGEFENMLVWADKKSSDLGFTGMKGRSSMYPDVYVDELQKVHRYIYVLGQTDFSKTIKEMGLENYLSTFEGKCTHPVK